MCILTTCILKGKNMKIYGTENNEFILRELGTRIKDSRIAMSISQRDMAAKAGLSLSTVIRMEKVEAVNVDHILNVMRVLNLLPNLEMLIEEQIPLPVEQLEHKKKRQRVSKVSKTSDEWKWGDET